MRACVHYVRTNVQKEMPARIISHVGVPVVKQALPSRLVSFSFVCMSLPLFAHRCPGL